MVMTQNEKVLKYLTTGKSLTSRQASSRFNIANLRARIAELREDGVKINATPVRASGTRAVSYSLATTARATRTSRTTR
jgi:hypothetical protein